MTVCRVKLNEHFSSLQFSLLTSYAGDLRFQVKLRDLVKSGVTQDGPTLYVPFTSDLPTQQARQPRYRAALARIQRRQTYSATPNVA